MLDCIVKVELENCGKSIELGMMPTTDYFVTEINGTPESVKEYYNEKVFNTGYGHYDKEGNIHEDHLMKVTNVFVLRQNEVTKQFCNFLINQYEWDWAEHMNEKEYKKFINQ